MSLPEKKRRRIPYSCILCRKKKIKCDKLKPVCSRCIKSGTPCEYEDIPLVWMGNSAKLGGSIDSFPLNASQQLVSITDSNLQPIAAKDIQNHYLNDEIKADPWIQKQRLYNTNTEERSRSMHVFEFESAKNNKQKSKSLQHNTTNSSTGSTNPNSISRTTTPSDNSTPMSNGAVQFQSTKELSLQEENDQSEQILEEIISLKSKLYALEQKVKGGDFPLCNKDSDGENTLMNRTTISLLDSISPNRPGFLFASKKNRFMCLGSFHKIVLWKRDPLIALLTETYYSNIVNTEKRIPAKLVDSESSESLSRQMKFRKETSLNLKEGTFKKIKEKKSKDSVKDLDLSTDELLNKVLLDFLPPSAVIDFHLRRYFDYIHPFVPVIDEENYRASLGLVLKFVNGRPTLILKNKMDYITISLMYLMIRFSYVLLSDNENPEITAIKERHPVEANVVFLVKTCILRSNCLRKSSLEILWLLMIYRHYNQIAPEDGDGGDGSDSFIFCGLIFQTALSMGLNRDLAYTSSSKMPQFYNERLHKNGGASSNFITNKNYSFVKIWNKTWWTLVQMDVDLSISYGKSLAININDSNTKIPVGDDDDFEIQKVKKFGNFYPVISRLINSLHNLNQKPLIIDIITDLRILESLREDNYPVDLSISNLNVPLTMHEKLTLTDSIKTQIKLSGFEMLVYYVLILKYESLNDINQYFRTLKRLNEMNLNLIKMNIAAILKGYTGNLKEFTKLFIPPLLLNLSRNLHILIYFILRFKTLQLKYHNDMMSRPNFLSLDDRHRSQLIDEGVISIIKIMRIILRLFNFVSKTYYYGVRAVGQFTYMLDCIENASGFPVFSFAKGLNCSSTFMNDLPTNQLNQLSESYKYLLDDPILKLFVSNNYFDTDNEKDKENVVSDTRVYNTNLTPRSYTTEDSIQSMNATPIAASYPYANGIDTNIHAHTNGGFMSILNMEASTLPSNVAYSRHFNTHLSSHALNTMSDRSSYDTPHNNATTTQNPIVSPEVQIAINNNNNNNNNSNNNHSANINNTTPNDNFLYDNMGYSNLLEDLLSTNDPFDSSNPNDPFTFFM